MSKKSEVGQVGDDALRRHFAMNHDVLRQAVVAKLWRSWETLRIFATMDLDVRTASVAMKILNIVCPKNRF